MLINPQTEKFCPEWYTYLSRSASHEKLKPRPNDRIDIQVYEKCFVGEARKHSSDYIKDCVNCHKFARTIMHSYYYLITYGYLDDLNDELDKFFNHLTEKHGTAIKR